MKNLTFTLALLLVSYLSIGQKKDIHKTLLSSKYAGNYSYGKDIEGPTGSICIYPETDTTVLFYIDINRGAPGYNMGSIYGQMKIVNSIGIFYTKFDYLDYGCKLTFHFSKNNLIVKGIEQEGCGFGNAVYADGNYKKTSNKVLSYFQDKEGEKIYFKRTKPKDYYK